jgi:hypothetical protein
MIKTLKLCMLALLVPATIYTKASVTFPKETAVHLLNELSMNENPSLPSEEAFSLALRGMESLKRQPGLIKKEILTVIDFSLPSTEKRMWIIDLQNKKVLFNDYVAHGRNSGDAKAGTFSNHNRFLSKFHRFLCNRRYLPGKTWIVALPRWHGQGI